MAAEAATAMDAVWTLQVWGWHYQRTTENFVRIAAAAWAQMQPRSSSSFSAAVATAAVAASAASAASAAPVRAASSSSTWCSQYSHSHTR